MQQPDPAYATRPIAVKAGVYPGFPTQAILFPGTDDRKGMI